MGPGGGYLIGDFQDREGCPYAAAGAAYASGVEEQYAAGIFQAGDVGMSENGYARSCGFGGCGKPFAARFYAVAVSVGEENPPAEIFRGEN
jgi:hypothetical protein